MHPWDVVRRSTPHVSQRLVYERTSHFQSTSFGRPPPIIPRAIPMTAKTRKTIRSILAISIDIPATPVTPRTKATTAKIKNTNAARNIDYPLCKEPTSWWDYQEEFEQGECHRRGAREWKQDSGAGAKTSADGEKCHPARVPPRLIPRQLETAEAALADLGRQSLAADKGRGYDLILFDREAEIVGPVRIVTYIFSGLFI